MATYTGQQRNFPAVTIAAIVALLCIYPGQQLVAGLFPGMAGLASLRPGIVIMDFPFQLPAIDIILAPALFFGLYPLLVLLYPSRPGLPRLRQAVARTGAVLGGVFAILFCMAAGGIGYFMVQDRLPRNIRNGLDAFGIHAYIHLPLAGFENMHVKGCTILLIGFIIGMTICVRRIGREPGRPKAVGYMPHAV